MPLHSTKEKKGARSIHFNFVVQGRFRPVSSISAVSIASRYDPIWPVRSDSGRISLVQSKSKPSRCKSKGKKKKVQMRHRHASNHVEMRQTQVRHPPSHVCAFQVVTTKAVQENYSIGQCLDRSLQLYPL